MEKIKKYKHIIIILVLIVFVVLYYQFNQSEIKKGTVDLATISDTADDTEKEVSNNPYIKQIRIALNGYLDGTNTGLEEDALYARDVDMKCGLNNFSKTYYQSKFVVLSAMDNEFGGIWAYIVFVDNPSTVFIVWVDGVSGDQRLRTFCEKPITSKEEADSVKEIIKNSTYTY
jgi:hypothetical protein